MYCVFDCRKFGPLPFFMNSFDMHALSCMKIYCFLPSGVQLTSDAARTCVDHLRRSRVSRTQAGR